MESATEEFITFLNNLFEKFPDLETTYKANGLYMTGESYAGHYIPAFSNALLDGGLNLKASLIGDPYTAGLKQKFNMYYQLPEALNIIDDSNMS